jgi:hypothetical protein
VSADESLRLELEGDIALGLVARAYPLTRLAGVAYDPRVRARRSNAANSMRGSLRWTRAPLPAALALALCCAGCETRENGFVGSIDLGDDIIAPDVALDEETFVCRIQPEVLTRHSCATGMDGELGGCHDSRSALRLLATDEPPPCNAEGEIIDTVPDAYARNLEAIRFTVQADPESSPLYLRPIGRAAHPRRIFDSDDAAAELIAEWIAQGAQ